MNLAEIATARLIGAVFVERGILSESQIRVALEIQGETGQQLGQILVERFGVTRQELASVVAEQWADIGRTAPAGLDPAANESWRRLGEIFVERGFVTAEQLEQALQRQRATGERVGEALVAQGSISKFELAGALAEQMSSLEEAAATEGEPAPAEATVVSLASRLEEYAPVEEQAPEPATSAPPVDEPVPSLGQTIASPEPLPFELVQPEPEPEREPEPAGSPEPPVEEPVPAFGETVVAPPAPVPFGVQPEPEAEPERTPEWQSAPEWQLPPEWQFAPEAESEPEGSLPPPVEEPAPALGQMLVAPPEPEPFELVHPETESEAEPERELQEAERGAAFAWVAFASTTAGYRLVQVDGPVPALGETISVADVGEVVVLRLGRSPVPNDTRPCVFLEQVARVDTALLV